MSPAVRAIATQRSSVREGFGRTKPMLRGQEGSMDGGRPIIPGPVTPLPSSGPRPPAMERRVQCARPNRLPHIRTPLPNPVQPNLGDQEADAWRSAVAPGMDVDSWRALTEMGGASRSCARP
ncbi:hypothetical protein BKA56DRAFT_579273 [Ilyonectria sp. MPI-CAGE-AT-0026]|nr:hypothetical protein BKA56DRAFT_579273 [Ilyonectria sp. MPI-CAGE-AT-0026]